METERVSLGRLKRVGLVALILILSASRGQAQCLNGFNYAICAEADTIFLQDQKTLGAVRISDGAVLWDTVLPQSSVNFNGPVATPDSVVIYAGFPDTHIDAFDPVTGQHTWHLETSSRDLDSFGSYILMNDPQYWDGLTALEGRTGKKVWHHPANPPRSTNPSGSPGHILLTKQHAIDADTGQVLQDWPKHWYVSVAAFVGNLSVIGTSDGQLAAYSPSYTRLWTKNDPKRRKVSGISGDHDAILVASYDVYDLEPGHATLELMSATSGRTSWSKEIDCPGMLLPSSVALVQGVAVFAMQDSRNSSIVQAFEAATGQQKWVVHTERKLDGDIVCISGHCFIGAFPGEVLMLDAQSGAASWLAVPKQ